MSNERNNADEDPSSQDHQAKVPAKRADDHNGKLKSVLKALITNAMQEKLSDGKAPDSLSAEEEAFIANLNDPEVARRLLERQRKKNQGGSQRA